MTIFFFFFLDYILYKFLASALSGCQFVYTEEMAYRPEAVCVYWVRGLSFGEGFCL